MELFELTAYELAQKLAAREVSSREAVAAVRDRVAAVEGDVQAFLLQTWEVAEAKAAAVDERRAAGEALPPLAGVPYALKDVICTRGLRTTCGSRILERFVPPYDATVVERLGAAGTPLVGKANMDEFAMGSSTENSAFQVTRNPWDLERVPGGSSGGSAAAVAGDECFFALGSDTGGSIRQPGSMCGIVGLKPTYGRVSRYGLVAYASSLDQIGPLTKDVRDAALVLNTIAGHDPRDSTTAAVERPDFVAALDGSVAGLKAGIITELTGKGIDPGVRDCVLKAAAVLEELGVRCEEVQLPHAEYALPCYYVIAPAECSSNLARYDGVRYGHRTQQPVEDFVDMFAKSRAEGFGPEVRLRIVKGTYVLSKGYYDAFYLKALKVRTLIKRDFDRAFERFDVLLCPVAPTPAFRIGEHADDPLSLKLGDICTLPVNLAGLPALSVPCGFADGLPVGLQVLAPPFAEAALLRLAHAYEQHAGWVGRKPPLGR